jgi:uncharacterized membrane protein
MLNHFKMTTQNVFLVVTATLVALIAGLFYAYSCSVNIGLSKLPDNEYIAAMQSINREIQNPLFFASFMGAFFLLPICSFLQYKAGAMNCFWLLLAAAAVYAIGAFGVTIGGNVPLNESLDKFNLHSATIQEISNRRAEFEVPWNRLHAVRTFASFIALVLVIIACVSRPANAILDTQ